MTGIQPGAGLLVRVGIALIMLLATVGTPADADLWGHITFGRDIVATGHIVQKDPYSFTNDREWVNHEWLSEIAFYAIYRTAGAPGLIALKLMMIAAVIALVWRHLRRHGVPDAVRIAVAVLAFVGVYWRMHTIRPQLFSVLLFAILVLIIFAADEGRRRGLLAVPFVLAIWANTHGGWIVGVGMFGLWTAFRIVDRATPMRVRIELALIGLAALGSTLLNPYGVGLWTFLGETVRLGRSDIEEWGSLLTYPLALGIPWGLTLAAAGLAIGRAVRRPPWTHIVMIAVLAVASARVSRLDAFFALSVAVLLAPQFAQAAARIRARAPARPLPKTSMAGPLIVTAVTVAAMLVPGILIVAPFATCLTMQGSWLPEPDAARFVKLNQLHGRMLTYFNWGEYAIWQFAPNLKVSMDGRRETVYSENEIWAHWRFYAAEIDPAAFLQQRQPDYIWLPKNAAVSRQLPQLGWTAVFTGPVSIVFARAGGGRFEAVPPARPGPRCFPGP